MQRRYKGKIKYMAVLFLTIICVQMNMVSAAMPGYFENPEQVYEQFKTQVYNPEFKMQYGFLKERIPVYSDFRGSKRIGSAPKYSGVLVVSKTDSYVQVIYEKKKGSGIGWILKEDYQNVSISYDGREKQLLADGTYWMENQETGGKREVRLAFQGDQQYQIQEIDQEQKSKEQRYVLIREYDHFYVKYAKSGKYLGVDDKNNLVSKKITGTVKNQFSEGKTFASKRFQWKFRRLKNKNTVPHRNFLQYDPAWARRDYGNVSDYSGKMAAAGCGVVAITNAVYALNGQFIDPMMLADFAVEKNFRIIGSGTHDGIFKAAAKKFGEAYGFYYVKKSYNTSEVREYLKKGCVAISHVPGHYVTVADFRPKTKKYLVLDSGPISRRPTDGFGNWLKREKLESGSLTSSVYYILAPTANSENYEQVKSVSFQKDMNFLILRMGIKK